ncbi:hypothetical protein BH11PAT1_BH11PAT1_1960 [soil metagenome]
MGKIRVKTVGIEDEEKKQADDAKKRAEEKRIAGLRVASAAKKADKDAGTESSQPTEEKTEKASKKKYTNKTEGKNKKHTSKKYQSVVKLIEKNKIYKLSEALSLLPQIKIAKFDETVELHLNTTESGISGNVTLPHGTGKMVRVAIATEEIIAEIEKGQINFDILVAEPQMMPKLAKVAKVLGPRGLMPNPKNGTVTPNPEEVAKKYAGGQMNFKTESKFPLMHLSVGKVSFELSQLEENIKAMIKAVQKGKIKTATLKSTMSPAIKLDLASL